MKPQRQKPKITNKNAVGKNMLPLCLERTKKVWFSILFFYIYKNIFPLFNYIKKINPPVQKIGHLFLKINYIKEFC